MRRPTSAALSALLAVFVLASPAPSLAASAADKATAREAATQGIELYRAGKYEDALDRLRRAQALYDAPVHLLYMARSQDKLGQLVEAAENYRLLDHYSLPEGAPEAWVAAVEDGRKELAALEPRIPKLRVVLDPPEVENPTLSLDGAAVSAAVVGIERPVNPGKHHVEVSAEGYAPGSGDVELAEQEKKDLSIHLEKSAGAAASPGGPSDQVKESSGPKRALVGFMMGLRLGGSVPTGKLIRTTRADGTPTDVNVSDAFQPGGGLELHAGVRIAHYFTPVLYVEGERFAPGNGVFERNALKNTSGSSVGLGLIVGTPPGKMGGFGEIDLAIAHSLSVAFDDAALGGSKTCSVTGSGAGLRLGGGGSFPLLDWFALTPFAMVTFAPISKLELDGCSALTRQALAGDVKDSDRRTHAIIFLGVGGDVLLGADRKRD